MKNMSVNLGVPESTKSKLKPRVLVLGVGGGGCNALNTMIASGLKGVEFVACNTDSQSLEFCNAKQKIQLGIQNTQGLGAGSDPSIGKSAAEESYNEICEYIDGAHMAFIAAGMGGGTGTGAVSTIAKACREKGILTVAVVTKPFSFEGKLRMDNAEKGIEELRGIVDTIIVIPADIKKLEDCFHEDRDIAAVMLEPSGGSWGRVPLSIEFNRQLRELTSKNGILLIYDEVITGFRSSTGGYQKLTGIKPDITVLGKIISGGLPGGAVAGLKEIMELAKGIKIPVSEVSYSKLTEMCSNSVHQGLVLHCSSLSFSSIEDFSQIVAAGT